MQSSDSNLRCHSEHTVIKIMEQLLCEERLNSLGFFHSAMRTRNAELWREPLDSWIVWERCTEHHFSSFFIYKKQAVCKRGVFLNSTELNFGMRCRRRLRRPKAWIDFQITISGYWSETKTLKTHTKPLLRVQTPVQEDPKGLIAGAGGVTGLGDTPSRENEVMNIIQPQSGILSGPYSLHGFPLLASLEPV